MTEEIGTPRELSKDRELECSKCKFVIVFPPRTHESINHTEYVKKIYDAELKPKLEKLNEEGWYLKEHGWLNGRIVICPKCSTANAGKDERTIRY